MTRSQPPISPDDLSDVRRTVCSTCGEIHTRGCKAHLANVVPPVQCRRIPKTGFDVCQVHGGGLPVVKEAAARRIAELELRRRFEHVKVSPDAALLDLVQYQAGMVAYWRARVEQITAEQMEWSQSSAKESEGFGQGGYTSVSETTMSAAGHAAYVRLNEAQRDLARFAEMALRAGVAERQVRIAEQQGQLFAGVQRVILQRMYDVALGAVLAQDPNFNSRAFAHMWNQGMSEVVPQELRALAKQIETTEGQS